MITDQDTAFLVKNAYLPEHIVPYVTAVSGAEPFLFHNFLLYVSGRVLIFVGYPLGDEFSLPALQETLAEAERLFQPEEIALIAPALPGELSAKPLPPLDDYFFLKFTDLKPSQKTKNMLRRAGRELVVERRKIPGKDHEELIGAFLAQRRLDEETDWLYRRIPAYLNNSSSAIIFEAHNQEGHLVAFSVADFWADRSAMYMFNFVSDKGYIPGTSDLLLWEIIGEAQRQKKQEINLGLGINEGIAFFKKKWGKVSLYPYRYLRYKPSRGKWRSLFRDLFKTCPTAS